MTPARAPQAIVAPPDEHTFFEQGPVKVTEKRFMVPGQTYPMTAVRSVRFTEIVPSRSVPIMLCILGVIFLAETGSLHWLGFGLGTVLLAIGIPWYHSLKSQFAVTLRSASGEIQAVRDHDPDYIRRIIRAVNEAIVYRGDSRWNKGASQAE